MIQHLTHRGMFDEIVSTNETVILDIYADWCQPCKAMKPALAEVANEYTNITFVAVKVEELDEMGMESIRREVNAVPTLMMFHKGAFIRVHHGGMKKDAILRWISGVEEI